MSNTFSAVENQIKIFKEMQDEIAKDTSILSDEERLELEGYVDNQRRQCELYLKLKPVKKKRNQHQQRNQRKSLREARRQKQKLQLRTQIKLRKKNWIRICLTKNQRNKQQK